MSDPILGETHPATVSTIFRPLNSKENKKSD